jgi:inner membrane protein
MDTLTQALLGATFGQACFGHRLGRRAVAWGAVGGLIPDLDIVTAAAGPVGEFLYHRGPTHSLWFGPVAGAAIGYAFWRWRSRREPGTLGAWMGLFVIAILTHPLLDAFTTYGTQLLWPFSRYRFAFDGIAIVDPLYSLALVAALAVGRLRGEGSRVARRSAAAALCLTTLYLFYGVWLNGETEARARASLAAEGVREAEVEAYPTLLQIYLRRVVVRNGDEVRVGWLSLWNPRPPAWRRFTVPRHPLIDEARRSREGRVFEWFTTGQTAPQVREGEGETVVEIDDLRFGLPVRPEEGLWGLRFRFDRAGRLAAPVQRFNRPLPLPAGAALAQIWRFTFGAD